MARNLVIELLVEWQLTPSGRDQLMQGFGREVKQAKVMHMLEHGPVPHQEFIDEEVGSAVLKTLEEKGWIESVEKKPKRQPWPVELENEQDKQNQTKVRT